MHRTVAFVSWSVHIPGTMSRRRKLSTYQCNSGSASKGSENKSDLLVIGGGAAGHMAAITCARNAPDGTTINLLEASTKVLSKVRVSGGGRCNVTSAAHGSDMREFAAQYPRGYREMLAVLSTFGPNEACEFFEKEGVSLKVESGGKVFPISDNSETIISALVKAGEQSGVRTYIKSRVTALHYINNDTTYQATVTNNNHFVADYVVIATGSSPSAHRWAQSLGHNIIPIVPSLFTFGINDKRLESLAGVAVSDCIVSLKLLEEDRKSGQKHSKRKRHGLIQRGPLLITHWGLSGPAVLSLSAFGARVLHEHCYAMQCQVDWVPDLTFSEKEETLRDCRQTLGNKSVTTVCPFRAQIPRRLWVSLVSNVDGFKANMKWSALSKQTLTNIAQTIHASTFDIHSKGEFKDEFVSAGGVELKGIDMKTFESRHRSGLYFAGETLDVDGRTGGYNLEFAWSSGYLAGKAVANALIEKNETLTNFNSTGYTQHDKLLP